MPLPLRRFFELNSSQVEGAIVSSTSVHLRARLESVIGVIMYRANPNESATNAPRDRHLNWAKPNARVNAYKYVSTESDP